MKKIISSILVCALLVCTLFTLASCGKVLSGTYEREEEILGQVVATTTYEFEANGKVTVRVDLAIGEDVVKEGEYEFNKDGDKITFTFENEDGELDSTTCTFTEGEEGDVKFIKLDNVKYEKVD